MSRLPDKRKRRRELQVYRKFAAFKMKYVISLLVYFPLVNFKVLIFSITGLDKKEPLKEEMIAPSIRQP